MSANLSSYSSSMDHLPRAGRLLPGALTVGGVLAGGLTGAKPNRMERATAGLSHAVTEFLRRARERRELAGLDETALRELGHIAKRAPDTEKDKT